jgi:hypothetical protein
MGAAIQGGMDRVGAAMEEGEMMVDKYIGKY